MCYSKDVRVIIHAEDGRATAVGVSGGNVLVANTGISHTWRRFRNAQREREVSLLEVNYA